MAVEIKALGGKVELEKSLVVSYREQKIGEFFADMFVDDAVIVEIKATDTHIPAFEAQLLNYLKATGIHVGLLINFDASVTVKRMVMGSH